MPLSDEQSPDADLSACDREPIHVPGRVQPHGVLLVVSGPELRVRHVSINCAELLGLDAAQLLDQPIDLLFGANARQLRARLEFAPIDDAPSLLLTANLNSTTGHRGLVDVLGHRCGDNLLLEVEPWPVENDSEAGETLHERVLASALRVQGQTSVQGLLDAAAREVRLLTGFDRVKVYRFDADWHGEVVAENKAADWHSYLGHHFPASDIPPQARQLYLLNRVRIIPDTAYCPADVLPPHNPRTGQPLDLTYAALRSVSPIHLEYLKNMSVGASMSISIVVDGRLWGLIACHHRSPRFLKYDIRRGCDHLGCVVASQLAANERAEEQDRRLSLKAVQTRLLERMASDANFVVGLLNEPRDLIELTAASGVAIYVADALHLLGKTPSREDVERLAGWITGAERPKVYATDALAHEFPPAQAWEDVASGVLAVGLGEAGSSQGWIIWFRPEVVRTLLWAGDPNKSVAADGRIHPRHSFEAWSQVVRQRSRPWSSTHVEAAIEFRDAVTNIVLRKADELSQERRRRTDAEAASRAKDRFLAALSHELRTPVSPVLLLATALADDPSVEPRVRDDARTIRRNIQQQTRLIDDLLDVTRIEHGKLSMHREILDLHSLLSDCLSGFTTEANAKGLRLTLEAAAETATVDADSDRLRQVFSNLLKNAVKFTPAPGAVSVRTTDADGKVVISVSDTGIGVDTALLPKLFDPFEQGSRAITDEFSGLGLGLAIAKGIVEAHGGTVSASSDGKGRGTTFVVELPAIATVPVPAAEPSQQNDASDAARLHILLVEDHHDTLRAMSRLLRNRDHIVTTADSVSTALAAAGSEKFDVLISDIQLSDGTGLDLMRELLKRRPIRGIALTGYGMESDIEQTREAGYVAHLIKPINFEELQSVLVGTRE